MNSREAFKNVYTESVDLVSSYKGVKLHSPNAEWDIPSVIRSKRYVRLPFTKSTLSKENIFKRDRFTCKYCGCTDKRTLTIDHITPRSNGGKNTWENLVTSCYSCNNTKGSRSLEELGWERPPTGHPHYLLIMSKFITNIPNDWRDYLFI